jgi:hypothetical protein
VRRFVSFRLYANRGSTAIAFSLKRKVMTSGRTLAEWERRLVLRTAGPYVRALCPFVRIEEFHNSPGNRDHSALSPSPREFELAAPFLPVLCMACDLPGR